MRPAHSIPPADRIDAITVACILEIMASPKCGPAQLVNPWTGETVPVFVLRVDPDGVATLRLPNGQRCFLFPNAPDRLVQPAAA